MTMVDVEIEGGGIFGLSVAWACLRRGARVRLIEARRIGAGASGGLVGALAPHAPERWDGLKQFQFDALCMAEGWWGEVAQAGGVCPGYARLGRLQPIADEAALARARDRAEGAARHWGGHATWEVIPAGAAGPFCPESPSGFVQRDTLSARVNPRAALGALAAAIRAGGGVIEEGCTRTGPARSRVLATGHEGLADLGARPGQGVAVKGQAALLACERRDAPQVSAPGLHVVPHADGTVAVGSTSEAGFTDPHTTDAQLEAVLARARALCPAIAAAPVIARWAGLRPRGPGRGPLLGPHPARPGTWIANGGYKIGFGLAPLVAESLATAILEGSDTIPQEFRPAAQ